MIARRIFARPARIAAIAPYLWMLLLFLVPFLFVLKISLSQTAIAQPPYLPTFDLTQGFAAIRAAFAALSLDNFRLLVSDNLYVLSYLRSLMVSALATAVLRSSMANTARLDVDAYSAGQRVVTWFTSDDCVVLEQ